MPCRSVRRLLLEKTCCWYRLAGLPVDEEPAAIARGATVAERSEAPTLWLNPLQVAEPEDLLALCRKKAPAVLKTAEGMPLAWTGCDAPQEASCVLTARKKAHSLEYPWEILDWHERLLPLLPGRQRGSVHPAVVLEGRLSLGEGSVILPGTVIEGFAAIGAHCKIGPNAYLRGCVSMGDGCIVGHAVELKNCILGAETKMAHLNYAGDSLLGDDVNVGGGSILSNYRHDGAEHCMMLGGKLLKTGRVKMGSVIEDGARLGANTTVYPGRIIGAGQTTLPGCVFR